MSLFDRVMVALHVLFTRNVQATARDEQDEQPQFARTPNPLLSDDGAAARQEAALGLLDDECQGFVLLTIRRERQAPHAEVCLQQHVEPSHWYGIALTMERIAREVRSMT